MNNARIVGRIVFHSNVRLRSIFTVLSIIMMATTARPEQVTLWTMADGMDGGGGGITMLNGDQRNGENGESADPFYTSPPPCHEWDPYLKEAVPSYDPATQGCCVKSDGSEEITDYPDNTDNPCDFLAEAPPAQGAVVCVNGKPHPCVFPQNFPEGWPVEVAAECLKVHEQHQVDNLPIDCADNCEVRTGKHVYPEDMSLSERQEEYRQRKCSAFVPLLECINNNNLTDDDPFLELVMTKWDSYNCDERLNP